jgi:hypothetical protein
MPSGTVGAAGNNGQGIAGINWATRMLGCKFLDSDGNGYLSDAIECVRWCRSKGAQVTLGAWSGGGYSSAMYAELKLSEVRKCLREVSECTLTREGKSGSRE